MKLSLNWIGRYVDLGGLSPEKVAEDLTLSVAEIEGIETFGAELGEVVVGEVLSCRPHPDSDHLHLCKVADGGEEALDVVCGAPNVAQGQKVPFARAGTVLPGGVKLKKTRIRGALSLGMILSEQEMGLAAESEGILVLPADAPVGKPLTEVLPVLDTILEIDNKSITHRPDLWGHYGFARELAALYGRKLKPAVGEVRLPGKGETVPIHIEAKDLCKRYIGLVLEGLSVGPAPAWMRYLLAAVGQRPISNIVDLTNFLLLDLGQPMHAFDLERLRGPEIRVRRAWEGEVLRTLDGVDRRLTPADLVIADAEGAVALAGVMGGEESEIRPETRKMLLESANFDPVTIRRTAFRTALRSESSARFEKSLDPALAMTAVLKFVELLEEVCPGAKPSGPAVDAGGWKYEGLQVPLRRARVALKLGVEIPDERIEAILSSLSFTLHPSPEGWRVDVPSFRATKDISIEDDLIEEIGRIYRYDNIPPKAPLAALELTWKDPALVLDRKVRHILSGDLRMREAYNYSFLPDDLARRLGLEGQEYLVLQNPIAENLSRIRRDVLPGLLGSLELNLRHREEVRLFEIGKGYLPEIRDERGQPFEVRQAAGLLARKKGENPFAEAKGALEHLVDRLDLGEAVFDLPGGEGLPPYVHPVRSLRLLVGGKEAGFMGELHPEAMDALGVSCEAALFSLDLKALQDAPKVERKYVPLPTYPPILVDVAVVVDEDRRVGEVEEVIRKAGKKLVSKVELFDIFRGPSLGEGKKSLAFHVTLLSPERTLGEKEEKKFLDRLRKTLPGIGASLRG